MTKLEIGCYGDGTFGRQHVRERCAEVLERTARITNHPGNANTMREIADALRGEMSDDAGEEADACDMLNDVAGRPDAYWGWNDGDFGLWPSEGE